MESRGICVDSCLNRVAAVQVTLTSSRPTQQSKQESAIQVPGMLCGAGASASSGGNAQSTAFVCHYMGPRRPLLGLPHKAWNVRHLLPAFIQAQACLQVLEVGWQCDHS